LVEVEGRWHTSHRICAAQEIGSPAAHQSAPGTPGTDGRDGGQDRLGFVPPPLCVMELGSFGAGRFRVKKFMNCQAGSRASNLTSPCGTQSSGMQLHRGFIPPVSVVGKATLGLGCISGSPEVGGTGGLSLGERATASEHEPQNVLRI
jgi:hypothetical protein